MIKLLIILLLAGCQSKPQPYVSSYESPFAPKLTEQRKAELKLHVTRQMWAETQLRHYEKGQTFTDRTEP